MRTLLRSALFVCLAGCLKPACTQDPGEGTLASAAPRIPEPMVYDLVRPLGAPRGELEIHSLFLRPLRRGRPLEWVPEVEYTFAKGHGIEFDLPAEGSVAESFKLAA